MDFFIVAAFILAAIWIFYNFYRRSASPKLPPGPYPLPVIGNLLLLDKNPHQCFMKLAQKYGPLFNLRWGTMKTVVVSSSAVAKQVIQKHDLVFRERNHGEAAKAHDHYKYSMGYLPIGPEWQKVRRIYHEHFFSVSCIEGKQFIRREKIQKLRDHIEKCSKEGQIVNISESVYMTTINLVSALVFSTELMSLDSGTAGEFIDTFHAYLASVAAPNLADFFPVLKWFDPQGVRKKTEFYMGKCLAMIDDLMKERLKLRASPDYQTKSDFLDVLLDLLNETSYGLSLTHIKHQILDLFVGGAESSAGTIEWAMTDLIRSPEKLLKLQNELDTVIDEPGKAFEESDIARLPYLRAVVKEVFRRYPAGALVFPHKSVEDVEVNGLFIPKGTEVILNVYAIGRDPDRWPNPDSFEPERFLDSKIEFKGQDFDLIPFGSGRRLCPGMPMASRVVHVAIATLVHNFDWKLDSKLGEVDNKEKYDLSLRRVNPLMATPIARDKRTSLIT